MKNGKKTLLLGVGLGLATAAVVAVQNTLTDIMTNLALERKLSSKLKMGRRRVSGSTKEEEKKLEAVKALSERLEETAKETVTITAEDGISLVGHYFEAEKPKRVIIAMHGWRSAWSRDFGGIADFWHKNGSSVLYAEQRGQNASGGDYMGFGPIERFDCFAWVKHIHERTGGKLPIYLAGISMGASTVLMTADFPFPSTVKGIMADCGYTSPKAIWRHVAKDNLHMPYGFISARIDKAYRRITNAESCYSCEDALREATVPVLFVHGTADKFVPVEMTYQNYMACASPKELLIVPGAEHGLSYWVEQDKYESTVKAFWKKYDGKPAKKAEEA